MNISSKMDPSMPECAIGSPQFWKSLLSNIRYRKVVPILGKDLLEIEVDGQPKLLERILAEKLAESWGKSLDPDQDMRHVIAFYKKEIAPTDHELHGLKVDIQDIVNDCLLPIPKPLRQLASIEGFTLYITTTFDKLLHRALMETNRYPDSMRVLMFDRTRGNKDMKKRVGGNGDMKEGSPLQEDLPSNFELPKNQTPVVYHLFGMACPDDPNPHFALTEEELLEDLVHAEQPNRQPRKLFQILHDSRLLVLGTSYPDWLARFFLRLATTNRLREQRKARELWVDKRCDVNGELAAFLHYYSIETDICFSKKPVDFVDLLYNKWQEYKGELTRNNYSVIPTLLSQPVQKEEEKEKRGKIFISYASEDRSTAVTFVKALEAKGLDVWWDQKIEVARKWDEAIGRQIEEACVFIALLSQHATINKFRLPARFLRREWHEALEKNKDFTSTGMEFIIPVYLDNVDRKDQGIRIFDDKKFQGIDAPSGDPPESLIKRLDEIQKEYRRSLQR